MFSLVGTMALFTFLTILGYIQGQIIRSSHLNISNEIDPLEESVVNAMLRTVDEKFDSLSSRMTSLERSLTSLQYYNLRQFRIVNTHLHALDTLLQAIHGRVGQQDLNNKELATSVSLLKREVKNMELLNKDSFNTLESNIAYLNKDLDQKITSVQDSIVTSMNKTGSGRDADDEIKYQRRTEDLNRTEICLETMSRVENKLDSLANFTAAAFENLTLEITREDENKTEKHLLFKSLIEVNDNVKQSISFYRHTGDLVERIVGATETVADDQDRIREDIKHFMEVQTNNSAKCESNSGKTSTNAPTINNELSNEISEIVEPLADETSKTKTGQDNTVPQKILEELSYLFGNTTKVMESLNDLAKLNQASYKNSILQLENVVVKLQSIRERSENDSHVTAVPNLLTGLAEFNLEELSNNTKAIYTMVEAIASNTGWIPYIFHNLQFVEGMVNQTLTTSKAALKRAVLRDTIKAKVSVQYEPTPTKTPPLTEREEKPEICDGAQTMNDTVALIDELKFVHKINQKMHRLIPSLTKLLGEPEPFFTLVDGESDNQGRVEVYRRGYWGTICDPLSHAQAAYICRHLGYLGGIATEPGHFGPGTGEFWKVNFTCLFSRQCEIASIVVDTGHCKHANDMGVICDHMVRLKYKTEDDEAVRRNSGYVEIYHGGVWTPVCSDHWISENSDVVCRQLGYRSGQNKTITDDDNIEGYPINTSVSYMNATCTGSEMRLDACGGGFWSKFGCSSKSPIFLVCS